MTNADGRPRDSQRARLYRAEGEVGVGRRLPTVEGMQRYVDALVSAAWFVDRWGERSFEVRPGFGHRRATADRDGVLQMPRWARSELVLLHEVAHCLTPVTCAPHGPEYAGVLLALARRGMGPATAQALEDAFARQRVRWTLTAVPAGRRRGGIPSTGRDGATPSSPAERRGPFKGGENPREPHGSTFEEA